MPNLQLLLQIVGAIIAVVGAVFAVRSVYRWLRPIRVAPSERLVFDGSAPDEIGATVTNRSGEAQYVVRCHARGTYRVSAIILRHLRHPAVAPRLYGNIWFNGPSFDLLVKGEPSKIEPNQRVILSHRLSKHHPLSFFLTPMLLVEVELSTGRRFRSRRLIVPQRWRFRP